MTVAVVKSEWSGFQGAPGLTVLCLRVISSIDTQSCVDTVQSFWAELANTLPTDVTITVDPTVDQFNEIDGAFTASFTAAAPPVAVTGAGPGVYSAASGYAIEWPTVGVVNNRRIRGRTFVVPCDADSYDVDGQVSAGTRGVGSVAGGNLVASLGLLNTPLVIWTRPRTASAEPPVTGRVGQVSDVTDGVVDPKVAILTSRRD